MIIWYNPFPVIIEQLRRFPMLILLAVAVLGLSEICSIFVGESWQVPMTIRRWTIMGVALNLLDQLAWKLGEVSTEIVFFFTSLILPFLPLFAHVACQGKTPRISSVENTVLCEQLFKKR
jgi:hypothetical protein